jgi:hypothetical protein
MNSNISFCYWWSDCTLNTYPLSTIYLPCLLTYCYNILTGSLSLGFICLIRSPCCNWINFLHFKSVPATTFLSIYNGAFSFYLFMILSLIVPIVLLSAVKCLIILSNAVQMFSPHRTTVLYLPFEIRHLFQLIIWHVSIIHHIFITSYCNNLLSICFSYRMWVEQ